LVVAAGAAIGIAASIGATRLIETMLFGVSRADPTTYIAVIMLLGVVATVAAWGPARRAVDVDPTVALRTE
jgi:ABC-type antimicrobial peptide transport system permease subunit